MIKKFLCVFCALTGAVMFTQDGWGATNPQIAKLIKEKQQKTERLEQCAQKVKGFKIAGISTLGLTAVGIGGNIALASKEKKLETQIDSTQSELDKRRAELNSVNNQISSIKDEQAKEAAAKAEEERLNNCQGDLWNLFTEKCSNCAAITKSDVCDYDLDVGAGTDGWLVDDNKKIIGFWGVSLKGDGAKQFAFKGCDCETLATSEKPEEKNEVKEEYEGIIGKECIDSTKKKWHIAEGTYVPIKNNQRMCLDEASGKVVNCGCTATKCVDGYNLVGGICKKTEQPKSNNPKMETSCTDGLGAHATGIWKYKDGSPKKCQSKDGKSDNISCTCEMTGCDSDKYEKKGNTCVEIPEGVDDYWAYGVRPTAIGQQCLVEDYVIYKWAEGKSKLGHKCGGKDCYCKKTTECVRDGVKPMYERKYNSKTGLCEEVPMVSGINLNQGNKNNSFTIKNPYQTQPQDNTGNYIQLRYPNP